VDAVGAGFETYHFSLFLAVDKIVVVLHGNELVPPVLLRDIL